VELQIRAETELLKQIAARVAHRYEDPVLFRNVRIFDSRNARLLDPADVYVHAGRVAAIYAVGSQPKEKVVEIDGSGRVLSPALFDMHAHSDAHALKSPCAPSSGFGQAMAVALDAPC
jgi:N-acyl-D-aspartate/D-glutamate deacylase